MATPDAPWPPPTGSPTGTWGWYLASDGEWYRSDTPPAAGYVLDEGSRWRPYDASAGAHGDAWRWSRWGLGDAGWAALVFVASSIVGTVVLFVVVDDTRRVEDGDLGVYANVAFAAVNALVFAGVPLWATRRKGLRSLRLDFGLTGRWADLAVGIGMGLGALFAGGVVASAIDSAFGVDEPTGNMPVEQLDGGLEIAAFFLAVAVLTPIIEELFFRGLLYRSFLKRGASTVFSIGATTAIFTAPHLFAADDLPSLVTLAATIAVLGLAFNLTCHLTGNRLLGPIVAHAVVNGTAVLALAFG